MDQLDGAQSCRAHVFTEYVWILYVLSLLFDLALPLG